jgi:DNA-binding MarR family transcriptional regulator
MSEFEPNEALVSAIKHDPMSARREVRWPRLFGQLRATTDDRKKAQDAYDTAKAELATLKPARPVAELEAMRAGAGSLRPIEAEILDWLRVAGGRAEGVRRLAAKIGRPRSTVSDECRRLAATGLITMNRGRHGTLLSLLPASRRN